VVETAEEALERLKAKIRRETPKEIRNAIASAARKLKEELDA
jgi:hypothetical protein